MKLTNRTIYTLVFLMSAVAMVLSLYYSYFGDIYKNLLDGVLFDTTRAIKPCDLCRYIRVAQYPLVLVSGLALMHKEYHSAKKYILGLSIFGLLFSGYKMSLEYGLIKLYSDGICGAGSVGCDVATNLFGTSISLATAGFISFVGTIGLMFLLKKKG